MTLSEAEGSIIVRKFRILCKPTLVKSVSVLDAVLVSYR